MTSTPAVGQSLSTSAAVRLIAGREIMTRLRSRSFIITTILLIVGVVAGGFLIKLAGNSISTQTIGLTPETASLAPAVEAIAAANGTDIELTTVTDDEAGAKQVEAGDLDALLTGSPESFDITVDKTLNSSLDVVTTGLAQQIALSGQIAELGGDPAQVTQAVETATPTITSLNPQKEQDGGQIAAGFIAGILIFIAIMMGGQMVAQGVVEEKSSRVVELLLAAVKPWQLMAGKVLGIGVIGLGQVAVIVGAGAATAFSQGLLDSSSLNLGSTALWALVWFVVGYTMFALVLAALAALVSRQEDVGSVIAPVTTIMMIPYIVGVSIAPWDPSNSLVVGMSYIPFCSPLLMPIRIALGTAGIGEILAVLALNLALIPVLVWLGGKIYSNAVLRTGSRIKLKEALRMS